MIRRLTYTECAQKLNKNSVFLMKIQSKYAVFAALTTFVRAYGVFSFLIHVEGFQGRFEIRGMRENSEPGELFLLIFERFKLFSFDLR